MRRQKDRSKLATFDANRRHQRASKRQDDRRSRSKFTAIKKKRAFYEPEFFPIYAYNQSAA